MTQPLLDIDDLSKTFTLFNQGGAKIDVFQSLNLRIEPGDCIVLDGVSGVGKSSLMRAIYGNYLASRGAILIHHRGEAINICDATPYKLSQIRRETMGYVSQFLRVIPRVPTLALVMEPLLQIGVAEDEARDRAVDMLTQLNLPKGHWDLPPATFSGGEQQRVNIARGFVHPYPLMLLDEPTASLDADNKQVVIELIRNRLNDGSAVVGIFHDAEVRKALNARALSIATFRTVH